MALVAAAAATETEAPAMPNEAAIDTAATSAWMLEVSRALTLTLSAVMPEAPSPSI